MTHKLSVLIPFYNASEFLEDAVESILSQTHQNLSILLLDDGSTDHSAEIAQKLRSKDERVHLYRNETNCGIIASRNRLLELCDTHYAAWMDADDIAHPERLEKQLSFMLENPDYAVCTCHYLREGMGEDRVISIPSLHVSREYLLFYNYILNPGSFFNVSLCKTNNVKFRDWISGASDYLFWVEMARLGKVGVVEEVLMTYRLHGAQETVSQKQRQLSGCLEIVQYQLSEFGCEAKTEDLARLMLYPAKILNLDFDNGHLKAAYKIVKTIKNDLPKDRFDASIVEPLLLNMYRSLARRTGVLGFLYFLKLFKFAGLRRSQFFGGSLLLACVKTQFKTPTTNR